MSVIVVGKSEHCVTGSIFMQCTISSFIDVFQYILIEEVEPYLNVVIP